MKFVALLRGINVGGNNKISMPELRGCFEEKGLENVSTYINSGNVFFETDENDSATLAQTCRAAIERTFGLTVAVAVISQADLAQALRHAPTWWDSDPESKHNAIFVIAPANAAAVMQSVGDIKPEYENVARQGSVIFWSAPNRTFSRSRWAKIVGTPAYKDITIRNARTAKKLQELLSA